MSKIINFLEKRRSKGIGIPKPNDNMYTDEQIDAAADLFNRYSASNALFCLVGILMGLFCLVSVVFVIVVFFGNLVL